MADNIGTQLLDNKTPPPANSIDNPFYPVFGGDPNVNVPNNPYTPPPTAAPSTDFYSGVIAKMQAQLQKSQGNADTLTKQAADFRTNLPGYIGNQVSGAQDASRSALAGDLQSAKTNANSRGLLYSGIETGNENNAKSLQSAHLASNIQDINKSSNATADSQDQLATNAQDIADKQGIAIAEMQAQQQQTNYQLALQQQQANNQYTSNVVGDVIGIGGILAGIFL